MAATARMERSRHELLARACLSRDEDGGIRPGDALEEVIDLLHGRAGADDLLEARQLGNRASQPRDLDPERAMLGSPLECSREDLDLEGLCQEVVDTGADCRDGELERPERRDHDHGHIGAILHAPFAELRSLHPRYA